MMVLIWLAMSVSSPLQAHEHIGASDAPLSATAIAALGKFDEAVAIQRAAYARLRSGEAIGPTLATRVALEQAMRGAIDPAVGPLSDADRAAASRAIWRRIATVDAANTAYVRSILPADGWFRSRRDGADVARDAWLIVQHSPDQAFQRAVVARMRPLVASGDARGGDYALLYDRTEMFAGRPQRYGSQMSCDGGQWVPARTEDPANLDTRRAKIGLPPMAEYRKNFEGRC